MDPKLLNYSINLAYLVASVLFILGLKGLGHPKTAVRGNLMGGIGMLIAIVAVLIDYHVVTYELIIAGILIGGIIGYILAVKVAMTSMPELVALFNGFGGIASILVAGGALVTAGTIPADQKTIAVIAIVASGIIGAITFWGSLVAYGKLQGLSFVPDRPVRFLGDQLLKALLLLTPIVLGYFVVVDPTQLGYFWILCGVASVLGIILVIGIGGADMPVVIALLNSYSGIAAAATGFITNNIVLIIAGALVGASGIILTKIMCVAMNRSLANVLFGGFGEISDYASDDDVYGNKVKQTDPETVALSLDGADRVVIIPGYGMAVSQAQHAVRDLCNLLEEKGTKVEFGIHPVAGRMPGHMNVLLAEADIPYDKLLEMDEVNMSIEQADVAIVVGANDVVNPVARTDPNSPIAGMPSINADKARMVVVIKRSLSAGFAGIPNPLFALDNSYMLFGGAKQMVQDICVALAEG